jgi:hypothetical protein
MLTHIFRLLFFSILVGLSKADAQKETPNFRSPLDIPLYLSGNFAELRSNHFHTGIDIKTQGEEGKAVYAVDTGYIARIKVSTGGYGKVIYIRHPNGYTSVYGHLQKMSKRIDAFLKAKQYEAESFTIELFPGEDDLPVSKGELIARSGNTGSSGGPHLHFEIRDTRTEEPLNPMQFGFSIEDNIPPIIQGLKIYALDESTYIQPFPNPGGFFPVQKTKNGYLLNPNAPVEVCGTIGLAIDTHDLLDGYPNKCGINRIELMVDSSLVFVQELNRLNFSTNRYINTYMDYAAFSSNRSYFHKQFISSNNKLSLYPFVLNKGALEMNDGKIHQVTYTVSDTYSNTTSFSFELKALEKLPSPYINRKEKAKTYFTVNGPNFFMDPSISIDIPPLALYEDMSFNYTKSAPIPGVIDSIYTIGNPEIPLQKYITVRFHTMKFPPGLEEKTLFVYVQKDNTLGSAGKPMEDDVPSLRTRSFGRYSLAVDTIPPVIKPLNIQEGKDMSTYNTFSLTITDNLAGIKKYRGEIDGNWILMEYEPKKNQLTYRFDNDRIATGSHIFSVSVEDGMGNVARMSIPFTR